jgi:hypothetical protein
MTKKYLAALTVLGTAAFSAGAADATPIIYINGVGIETGFTAGGIIKSSESSYENLITQVGQELRGVFQVAQISGVNTGITYQYGDNSAYLHGVFDGFTATSITNNGTSTEILFTGGSLRYYVSNTDTFTFNSDPAPGVSATGQATDYLNAQIGTPWLILRPDTIDAAGNTLRITIPGLSLTSFAGAAAFSWLDVIGGSAATAFDTNTFDDNAFGTFGVNDDVKFQGGANSDVAGDWPISGDNFIKANATLASVPEPLTLSLFGAGLLGAAAFGRRKHAKRA